MVTKKKVEQRFKQVWPLLTRFFRSPLRSTLSVENIESLNLAGMITIDPNYMTADVAIYPQLVKDNKDLDRILLHEAIHLSQEDFFILRSTLMDVLPESLTEVFDKLWTTAIERNTARWEAILEDWGVDVEMLVDLEENT